MELMRQKWKMAADAHKGCAKERSVQELAASEGKGCAKERSVQELAASEGKGCAEERNGQVPVAAVGKCRAKHSTGRARRLVLCAVLILTMVMTMIPLCTASASVSAAQNTKLIAFTFDDGPSKFTPTLLDGLRDRGVVATFFMCGTNGSHGITNHSALLDRMVEEGHQLSNHSWDHPSIAKLSGSQVATEFGKVESLLFDHMGGSYIDMVRTPGGAYNSTIQNNTKAPIIIWSVDTLDWKIRDASSVYNKIMSNAKDGSIVLMHDIYQTSVQGALRAVDSLKSQGYEFVTVSELLRRRGITPSNGIRYYSALNNGTTLPAYQAPAVSSYYDDGAEKTMVTFSSADAGITMYYTTDGSYPKLSSARYTGPIPISADTTFKVVGYDKYGTRTPAAVQTVKKYQVASPKASAENGMITLRCDTAGAEIYYTTDGTKPTAASNKYTGPFPAEGIGNTLKIIGMKTGVYPSVTATYAVTDNGMVFGDVDPSLWYFPAVNKAVCNSIMNGMGDESFAPQGQLTRAMMVQILYNIEGRPEIGKTDAADEPSTDGGNPGTVNDNEPADPNQEPADPGAESEGPGTAPADPGAEIGDPGTAPADPGTETEDPGSQTAVPEFQDVTDDDWFADAVRWAAAEGIVNGYSETEFGPRDNILREQLVTMLYRYADKYKHIKIEGTADLSAYTDGWSVREYAQDAFRWAIANGIINGYSNGALDPHNTATRAEAATILVRYTEKEWQPAESPSGE